MHRGLKKFFKDRKAQVGIGTLIIFIAMVLVAAVAAGVLLRTSGVLQQKATATGTAAVEQVTTAVVATNVIGYAEDPTSGEINETMFTVQLAAGSSPINLNDIVLTYLSENVYISGILWDGNTTLNTTTYTDYTSANQPDSIPNYYVVRTKETDKGESGILEIGDTYEIHFWIEDSAGVAQPLSTGTGYTITVTPAAGSPTVIAKVTPSVIKYDFTPM